MRRVIPFFLCVFLFLALFISSTSAQQDVTKRRMKMVHQQLEARDITDPHVLEAMRTVKRHLFVPKPQQWFAYADRPLSIGYGQTISQPYIVAYMTEAAQLKSEDKILEIGTGSGYQAAVLAHIVKEVYSIEIIEALAKRAEKTLNSLGYQNIFIKHGDGYQGWQEYAPYDAIIVTAAPDHILVNFLDHLNPHRVARLGICDLILFDLHRFHILRKIIVGALDVNLVTYLKRSRQFNKPHLDIIVIMRDLPNFFFRHICLLCLSYKAQDTCVLCLIFSTGLSPSVQNAPVKRILSLSLLLF